MSNVCTLAIVGWEVVGIAAVGFGLSVFLMWLWFIVLGRGNWS